MKLIGEPDFGQGHRLLLIFCAFCGQSFHSLTGWRAFLMKTHKFTTDFITIAFLALGTYNLYLSFHRFSLFLYFCAGYITISEAVFRSAFVAFRERELLEYSVKIQNFLNHPYVQAHKKVISRKLSRWLLFLIVYFMFMFGTALYLNAAAMNSTMHKEIAAKSSQHRSFDIVVGLSKVLSVLSGLIYFLPQELCATLIVITCYLYSFFMIGRLVSMDLIFFSWYFNFLESFALLTQKLPLAISRDKRVQRVSLKQWLLFQQDLSRFLCDINRFLSPVIGAVVVLSGFKICLLAIACVKMAFEFNSAYMILSGVMLIQRVFLYCMMGQQIKEKISALHATAFRSSWFGAKKRLQNAALMICSAANERAGLTLPGSPFFALSLEFFATVMSAVFTYFIVIIQIQNKGKGKLHGRCVRIVLLLNALLGFPFAWSVLNVKPRSCQYYLWRIAFVFSNLSMIAYTHHSLHYFALMVKNDKLEISTLAFVVASSVSVVLIFVKSLCAIAKHSKYVALFKFIKTCDQIDANNTFKAAKKCIVYLIFHAVVFAAFFIITIIMAFQLIDVLFDKRTGRCRYDITKYFQSGNIQHIEKWLNNYHLCMRFLQKVNNLTAPSVIATVVLCTFQVCLSDYIAAMGLVDPHHAFSFFLIGVMSLLQIFIYCYLGHKIRKVVSEIHTTVHRRQWTRQPKQIQHAIMMIANLTDGPNCMPRIGAPFFDLSMEFFVSIIGVTITYLLVLLQFK
ncbi:Hypothetical predicted protein [Cloeon dipterum]|uniref:Gustatory receptor n=1 Tax=Cloeon dipterum TaxID=197152 RepID=A0A8S1CPA6_9INSE|nr:Hypothetical predicted protein [Cloeon dipterum]